MKKGQKIEICRREPLSDEEINKIIINCDDIEKQYMIIFMADSGCRVNELIRSRKDWFDHENNLLWIMEKKKGEVLHAKVIKTTPRGAKTKKDRFVELTPRLKDISLKFFDMYTAVDRSPAWIYCMVRDIGIDCDIEKHVTPHIFRHSYIQKIFDDTTLKSKEIGTLVGHCDGTMVENNYTHGDNRDIINKLRKNRSE